MMLNWVKWPKWIKLLITLFVLPLFLLATFIICYLFFFMPVSVVGSGMFPSYKKGQYLIARKLDKSSLINHSEVVIYRPYNNSQIEYIKRVIGIPGDQIDIRGEKIYLNNKLYEEPYLSPEESVDRWSGVREKVVVPNDHYLLLSDNGNSINDLEGQGALFVPRGNIIGKVLFCFLNCDNK